MDPRAGRVRERQDGASPRRLARGPRGDADNATNKISRSSTAFTQKWVACSESESFTEDCVVTCGLTLPSVAQVDRCKSVQLLDDVFTYVQQCLKNSGAACSRVRFSIFP